MGSWVEVGRILRHMRKSLDCFEEAVSRSKDITSNFRKGSQRRRGLQESSVHLREYYALRNGMSLEIGMVEILLVRP